MKLGAPLILTFKSGKGPAKEMAKRNDDQAIENKRFREIADFGAINDLNDLRRDAKRLVSFGETILSFSRFLAPSTQETKQALRAGTAAMS